MAIAAHNGVRLPISQHVVVEWKAHRAAISVRIRIYEIDVASIVAGISLADVWGGLIKRVAVAAIEAAIV